ncbi:cytosolic phospholipase A2-like [Cloeon dipterum]|uniref:cytosolic phospholipase A2-like n=1 Tax=Cloeon dipterum TaxID=197152 RepID=UPI00321FCA1C
MSSSNDVGSTELENTDGAVLLALGHREQPSVSVPPLEVLAQFHPNTHKAAEEAAKKSFSRPAALHRQTSGLWGLESFDPFQQYKVNNEQCVELTVVVLNGEKITKGWFSDLVDKPDPYVRLDIRGIANGRKQTSYIENSKNPEWNQKFKFRLPGASCGKRFKLDLRLMDSDVLIDDKIGKCSIDLSSLKLAYGEAQNVQAKFGNGSIINLSIKKELNDQEPDLRYSLALCDDEKSFVSKRREVVYNAVRQLIGEVDGPDNIQNVPVIGVLGSGGGIRAMVGFSGAYTALHDLGILDCVTFAAALSGSTWYLSFLYSHPDFPKNPPGAFKEELQEVASKGWGLTLAKGLVVYLWKLRQKYKSGQPISLTDIFGHILGDMILKDRKNSKLSTQRRVVHEGKAPLPLYTCLNVKNNVPANVYQEWVEFSPYEIGIPKYGAFVDTEFFGSKFYLGQIVRNYPELPLHYLQGVWGSGFSILLKRFFSSWEELKKSVTSPPQGTPETIEIDGFTFNRSQLFSDDDYQQDDSSDSDIDLSHDDDEISASGEGAEDSIRLDNSLNPLRKRGFLKFLKFSLKSLLADSNLLEQRSKRAGLVFNPLRGLTTQQCFPMSPLSPTNADDAIDFKGFYEQTKSSAKRMLIVDAGLNINIPFPALLRPQRGVDMYLSFDFTNRDSDSTPPFKELKLSEQWARLNHLPFPPVAELATAYEKEEMREFYLFEDETDPLCPSILHFVLCNNQFRRCKAPGVPRSTESETKFADFAIFDDPDEVYSTFNFCYTAEQFNRLHELMEFNVRLALPDIKQQIKLAVDRKKKSRESVLGLASDLISGDCRYNNNCESTVGEPQPLFTSHLHFGPLKVDKKL